MIFMTYTEPVNVSFGAKCRAKDAQAHLRLEAHVEHPIGFVEDEVGDSVEVDDASRVGRQELDHAPGSADDEFGSTLHVGDVVLERGSTVCDRGLDSKKKS